MARLSTATCALLLSTALAASWGRQAEESLAGLREALAAVAADTPEQDLNVGLFQQLWAATNTSEANALFVDLLGHAHPRIRMLASSALRRRLTSVARTPHPLREPWPVRQSPFRLTTGPRRSVSVSCSASPSRVSSGQPRAGRTTLPNEPPTPGASATCWVTSPSGVGIGWGFTPRGPPWTPQAHLWEPTGSCAEARGTGLWSTAVRRRALPGQTCPAPASEWCWALR